MIGRLWLHELTYYVTGVKHLVLDSIYSLTHIRIGYIALDLAILHCATKYHYAAWGFVRMRWTLK